jgi:hypothetical protein
LDKEDGDAEPAATADLGVDVVVVPDVQPRCVQ